MGFEHLRRPAPTQLFWSRCYGQIPLPWSRYDVASGELQTEPVRNGLHGDLRDATIDQGDHHAWFLLSHGLARIDLEEMREVAVLRERFPRYLWHLHRLRRGMLAATGWSGETVTLIDTAGERISRTLRMPSPDAVVGSATEGRLDLVAFNAGIARSLDLETLTFGAPRQVPIGKGPLIRDEQAWIVQGRPVRDPLAPRIRRIAGERVVMVDLVRGAILAQSPPLPDPDRVVGIDADGRPVVHLAHGFSVLDPGTLQPRVTVIYPWGSFGALAMLPDGRSAAALPNGPRRPERLLLFRWSTSRLNPE